MVRVYQHILPYCHIAILPCRQSVSRYGVSIHAVYMVRVSHDMSHQSMRSTWLACPSIHYDRLHQSMLSTYSICTTCSYRTLPHYDCLGLTCATCSIKEHPLLLILSIDTALLFTRRILLGRIPSYYTMHWRGSIDTMWSAFRASGKPSTCQRIVWMGQVQWHSMTAHRIIGAQHDTHVCVAMHLPALKKRWW